MTDRYQLEADFIAALRPVFEREYRRAIAAPTDIPYGVFLQELAGVMARSLKRAFLSAGVALIAGNSLVVSAGAFNQQAEVWATAQAVSLASKVVKTSRELAMSAIYEVMRGSPTNRDAKMAMALAPIFMADSRLENIAITEVTRGLSAGENAAVLYFPTGEQGRERQKLIPIWETREDEKVCPICRPFDGHGVEVWGPDFPDGPPAHPRCRCRRVWIPQQLWIPPRRRAA